MQSSKRSSWRYQVTQLPAVIFILPDWNLSTTLFLFLVLEMYSKLEQQMASKRCVHSLPSKTMTSPRLLYDDEMTMCDSVWQVSWKIVYICNLILPCVHQNLPSVPIFCDDANDSWSLWPGDSRYTVQRALVWVRRWVCLVFIQILPGTEDSGAAGAHVSTAYIKVQIHSADVLNNPPDQGTDTACVYGWSQGLSGEYQTPVFQSRRGSYDSG